MSGNQEEAKKIIVVYNKEALAYVRLWPWWAPLSSSPSKVISSFLMSVDHVDNARRRHHGECNNSKDDREGLAGPTDGLIQCLLLIREARIIGPHVRDGIVVRLFTGAC